MSSTNSEPITILVVEDHELTRVGLRLTLERSGDFKILDEATNGLDAVRIAEAGRPDVVLMDIALPGLDGISATKQIKAMLPNTKIVMMTSHEKEDDVFASFAAGADGYCLKGASIAQLELAIKSIASGATWLDPVIAHCVLKSIPRTQLKDTTGNPKATFGKLTDREAEVLKHVVDGMSNQEIADKLVLSVETVKTHMRRIMEKLAVSDRTQAAVKAMRQGLVG